MTNILLASLFAMLTACSTAPVPVAPDITEERLHLHLEDSCKLLKEPDGLYLDCDGEPKFMVNDDCVIEIENKERVMTCGE